MNTHKEASLVGLSLEKMQKVSKFRVDANLQLAKAGKTALPVNEAVKYLHAARFDIPKAEDIFRTHQAYKQQYDLENLHSHKQQLNGEIRSKKLEIVGARDSDGAQLMVFTASRHNPYNSETKAAIQLLFLLLDQISESIETQSKGVTMVFDLRETSLTNCDYQFIANIVGILNGGYPVFLSNVYMIDAPSWLKGHMKQYDSFRNLQSNGKLKLVTLSDLARHIPKASLPHSLGGTMTPAPTGAALSGRSAADTVAMYTRHISPSHSAQKPRQPPVAPPPRTRIKPKSPPLDERGDEGTTVSPKDSQESVEDQQPVAGAVNKIRGMFNQTGPTPSPHPRPAPPPRAKPSIVGRPVAGLKVPKPSPPPRSTSKNSQPVPARRTSPDHKAKVSLLLPSHSVVEKGGQRKPAVPLRTAASIDVEPPGSGSNQDVQAFKNKLSHIVHERPPGKGEKDQHTFQSADDEKKVDEKKADEKKSDGVLQPWRVFRRSNSDLSKNHALKKDSQQNQHKTNADEKGQEVPSSRNPAKRLVMQALGVVRVPTKSKAEPSTDRGSTTSQSKTSSDSAELSKPTSAASHSTSAKPLAIHSSNQTNVVSQYSMVCAVNPTPASSNGIGGHDPPTSKPPCYENKVLKNSAPPIDSGYETVEFTALPTDTEDHLPPPVPGVSSARPTLPYAVTTVAASQVPESSRVEAKPRIKVPTTVTSVTQVRTKTEASEGGRRAPPRKCYENVFLKKSPGDHSDSEDEGVLLDDDTNQQQADENIYENFGPDEGNKNMSMHELEQYIEKKGRKGLSAEYYRIKNNPLSGPSEVFKLPWNSNKNRYRDVVCYDETRVPLKAIPGVKGSDYIHANYVDGYKKPKAFILTQGPMKRTVNDYWRMLWEQKVFVVVMTTKCVELGKLKCAQYWPEGNDTAHYDDVSVSVIHSEDSDSYIWRQLLVKCNGESHMLMHYQYVSWPDYGVPETGEAILNLIYAVREMQGRFSDYVTNPHQFQVYGPPIVIHCSAGIGRSGTFCALDHCIDELRETGRVNLQQAVMLLREQRAFSIQTDEQYEFCYRTLLEYALTLRQAMGSY